MGRLRRSSEVLKGVVDNRRGNGRLTDLARWLIASVIGLAVPLTQGCMPYLCSYSRDVARIADPGDSDCKLKKDGLLRCEGLAIRITSYTKRDACDDDPSVFVGRMEDADSSFAMQASAYMVEIEFEYDEDVTLVFDPAQTYLIRADGRREAPVCIVEFPRGSHQLRESSIQCDPAGGHDATLVMTAHEKHGAPEESRRIQPLDALELTSKQRVIAAFHSSPYPGQGLSLGLGTIRWNGISMTPPVLELEVKHGKYPTLAGPVN